MAGIIIIDGESRQGWDGTASINKLAEKVGGEISLIAPNLPDKLARGISFISRGESSVTACIQLAAQRMESTWVLLVNGMQCLNNEAIDSLACFSPGNRSVGFMYLPSTEPSEQITDITAADLIGKLTSQTAWPFQIVAVRRETLAAVSNNSTEGFVELAVCLMIQALSQGGNVAEFQGKSKSLYSDNSENPQNILSDQAVSRCLTVVVNSFNIENIFPDHPWTDYEEESAAASYHTVAAMFLRYGDIQAATQCISLSERLEESPRSLALKGLIAMEKGEMLGAVANMVSSLQQYECRKKNEKNAHYLTFTPRNLEVINLNLSAGLDALNKQDNEKAASYFAQAVFNFDSFYSDYGLDRVEH